MTTRVLWLLRHAKAVPDPPPGQTDHERPLAPRGRRDADALGRRLGEGGDRLGLDPGDLPAMVLCSTATRTVETAERVLAGSAVPTDSRRALYGASPELVLREISTLPDEVHAVMVVGHNPTLHAVAAGMAPAGDRARRMFEKGEFPTCALAVYRLPVEHWLDTVEGIGALLGLFTPPY